MSSVKYATPLYLELRPSPVLAALFGLLHIGALIILFLLPIPLWLSLASSSLVLYSLLVVLGRVLLLKKEAIVRLNWGSGDEWTLHRLDGQEITARLLPTSYVHPWMVVLNFKDENRRHRRSVVLMPGCLDRDTFRRLRVRLNLQHNFEG